MKCNYLFIYLLTFFLTYLFPPFHLKVFYLHLVCICVSRGNCAYNTCLYEKEKKNICFVCLKYNMLIVSKIHRCQSVYLYTTPLCYFRHHINVQLYHLNMDKLQPQQYSRVAGMWR